MDNKREYLWATTETYDEKGKIIPYDYLAPDGSEIRLLPEVGGGGLCHCTLPVGKVSNAVSHKTVDEIWYILSGQGQVWRKRSDRNASVVDVGPGTSINIPFSTQFQFRNTGDEPLCILIATIPRWPGPKESIDIEGNWKPTVSQ